MSTEASMKLSSGLDALKVEKESLNVWGLKLDDLIRWLLFIIIAATAVIYICDLIISCLDRAESIGEWMVPP
ncbi:MAG TPA: hypothetical protein PKK68_06125, partial [Methanothrix soehngenii]|nr:hypothetical protein [Methanothrix soehngenii]